MVAGEDTQTVDDALKSESPEANSEKKDVKTHPESVTWTEYVGLKEKLSKSESRYKEQVQSLEEQVKKAPSAEEFEKTKKELDELKSKHEEVNKKLNEIVEKSLSEKRKTLIAKGVPEEKVKSMSEDSITATMEALGSYTPKPDFGSGGSAGGLVGSPIDLARQAYSKSK